MQKKTVILIKNRDEMFHVISVVISSLISTEFITQNLYNGMDVCQ